MGVGKPAMPLSLVLLLPLPFVGGFQCEHSSGQGAEQGAGNSGRGT